MSQRPVHLPSIGRPFIERPFIEYLSSDTKRCQSRTSKILKTLR